MARLRSVSRLRTGSRRRTGWSEGPGSEISTQVNATATAIVGSALVLAVDGATLVRTRGILSFVLTSSVSAGDGFIGAFGIGKVTATAIGIGVTAVPAPIDEMDWDGWLWHQFISVRSGVATAAATPFEAFRYEIDSKAMRKVADDEGFVGVLQTVETGDADMRVSFDTRMLFKLP